MIYLLFAWLLAPLVYPLILLRRRGKVDRVLVVQTAKIGDVICGTPILREIKKRYPACRLSVMVTPITAELLEFNPHVDEIIKVDAALWRGFSGKLKLAAMIREGSYDAAVCLNPGVTFAFATFCGLVPIRLSVLPESAGVTSRLAGGLFTHLQRHTSGRLVIETYMAMLKGLDIDTANIDKEVYKVPGSDTKAEKALSTLKKPIVGIGVSSGNKLKELGEEKVAAIVATLLDELGGSIVLVGSEHDRRAADTVTALLGKRQEVVNAAGLFTLAELPALIERLSLYIGVDSGITYMADALAIPLVHLSGPIDTSEQRPYGKRVETVSYRLECVPCTYVFDAAYECRTGTRECIGLVRPEDITAAAVSLLKNTENRSTP
ncbi:MAG: glycosyltransferase family 9 protein [Geobacter sp.]|nr:glycosyltransferase family 9 protein [Geobacter sp.]